MSDASPTYLEHDWFPVALPDNILIGERSWCYSSFAFIHCRSTRPCAVRVGTDSGIYHGSFFELGPDAEVLIGDYCAIVGAIINTNGSVVIGDYTFIAHEVVFADTFAAVPGPPPSHAGLTGIHPKPPEHGSGSIPGEEDPGQAGMAEWGGTTGGAGIVVGANCWIGARAVLLDGARLGEGVIVGAAAVVDFEVPAFSIVAGNPALIVQRSKRRDAD